MKAQRLSTDRISSLPENILETILCLIPIKDAVRTSILSREWRYHWTKIPKLEFDYKEMFGKSTDKDELSILEQMFEQPPSERKKLTKKRKVVHAIFQVLLLHEGPLLEFTLYMNADDTCVEIDQLIRHLSKKNTLKKLTLQMKHIFPYQMSASIFALRLTELYLQNCHLDHEHLYNVSGSLTTIYMADVYINTKAFLHLISKTPLLKSLTMVTSAVDSTNSNGLTSPEYFVNRDDSTITELFECLRMIEHLSVSIWVIKCFIEDMVPRELPTTLVHLKYFHLDDVCSVDKHGLPFLVRLIRCSPNLEKIKLVIFPQLSDKYSQSEIDSVTFEEFSDISLEHLRELMIVDFCNLKPELEFVKFILVKSPMLKKVRIFLSHTVSKDEELKMLKSLLCTPRASLVVKIFVGRCV